MILNGNWIMNKDTLLQNALKGEFLSPEEGVFLFETPKSNLKFINIEDLEKNLRKNLEFLK